MVYDTLEAFTELHKKGSHLAEDSPPTITKHRAVVERRPAATRTVLSLLKDEKFITEKEGGLFFIADPPAERDELMERAKQYEAAPDRRIASASTRCSATSKAPGCRNQVILSYLGEPEPPKCGRCDNCLRSREAALAASTEATRLGASLTRQLDDEPLEVKPRREIKARVVRIDQPAPNLTGRCWHESLPSPRRPHPRSQRPCSAAVVRARLHRPLPVRRPTDTRPVAAAAAPAPAVVTRQEATARREGRRARRRRG